MRSSSELAAPLHDYILLYLIVVLVTYALKSVNNFYNLKFFETIMEIR